MTREEIEDSMTINVYSMDWHRNGICGEGFWSIRFSLTSEGTTRPNMHASLFYREGYCAVHDLNDLESAFRGDWFEPRLRQELQEYQAKSRRFG